MLIFNFEEISNIIKDINSVAPTVDKLLEKNDFEIETAKEFRADFLIKSKKKFNKTKITLIEFYHILQNFL